MNPYLVFVGLAVHLLLTPTTAGDQAQTSASLRIPDGQCLLLSARAEGVQIYTAKIKPGASVTYEWTLKGPRATLFDQAHRKIGIHFGGPTWELNDGSKVVGAQPPKQRVGASNAQDIAWLLLEAKSHERVGLLDSVTNIMRVDTAGGIAPAKPPTYKDQVVQVKYRATYIFLAASPISLSRN